MRKLNFSGNITLAEVFDTYRGEIYNNLVKSIKENLIRINDPSKFKNSDEFNILTITINRTEYSINLTRDKFINGLNSAIQYYKSLEEYEKCQECLNMIEDLKK